MSHGIHHVTAISGPAARNLAFYSRVLGLRLVKRTVNFDDPTTYHLYYGDESGSPGTILTFFPWENVAPGRVGIGTTQETAFRVPAGSIGFWAQRFVEKGVAHETPQRRFGETVLPFRDPDGMQLALVGQAGAETEPAFTTGEISAEEAIRGFRGVTLLLEDSAPTGAILTDVFGFAEAAREGSLARYRTGDGSGPGQTVDLRAAGGFLPARSGGGSVHHIAFRAADDADQEGMVRRLREHHGMTVTPQKDRNYFRSVYFREPGGILFEIATDAPGFSADEPAETLGTRLKLPPFLESQRQRIEERLPALD